MRYDHSHTELAPLPDHAARGPDPEPLGDRFHVLMALSERAPRTQRLRTPHMCPLAVARGNHRPCSRDCLYFDVPGVPMACAVAYWAPEARHDEELAQWFEDRRRDAAIGSNA